MDTRSSPNKTNSITWWISSNSSPTSEPTKELLTLGGEHHGIGNGEGLVMTKIEDPPLRIPKRTPDLSSQWTTGGDGGSVSWNTIILSPSFFFWKIGFYSVGFRVCGATRWGQPTWACLEGVACPGGLCPPKFPLRWFLAPEILFYCIKNPCKALFHSENFYFCTKTTPW